MHSLYRTDIATRWRRLKLAIKPRPNTGSLWKDIAYLLLIVWIQTSFFPTLSKGYLQVDLLTPWLVISFIRQHLTSATILAIIGAISLETRSAVPAGLYICAYWITANIIAQVRPALSWRHLVPWAVTYALAALWIILFESLVMMTSLGLSHLHWTHWINQLIRIISAVAFGMYLAREWHKIDAEEPIPQ